MFHYYYVLVAYGILTSCMIGPFQAYDQHLNMILGDVEETVTTVEIDEETYEEGPLLQNLF